MNRNEGFGNPSTNQVFDQILSEQDRGLDSLHNVIVRSRVTAQNIHSEVGVQNEIIDGLGMISFLNRYITLTFNNIHYTSKFDYYYEIRKIRLQSLS